MKNSRGIPEIWEKGRWSLATREKGVLIDWQNSLLPQCRNLWAAVSFHLIGRLKIFVFNGNVTQLNRRKSGRR
jgi:hypothetical protein